MPALAGTCVTLFQTPASATPATSRRSRSTYGNVHRDVNPTGIVPKGMNLAGPLTAPPRGLGGHPFETATAPGPIDIASERGSRPLAPSSPPARGEPRLAL